MSSSPLLGIGIGIGILEEGESNVSMVGSTTSLESICQNSPGLRERNYMGLSDSSSVDSSCLCEEKNLKATELRLGLPGSQSPERAIPSKDGIKTATSGNKRGFSDAMNNASFAQGNWMFPAAGPMSGVESSTTKEILPSHDKQPHAANDKTQNKINLASNPPAAKAQVVGWPPIRSFRKNTLSATSKNNEEVDGKPGPGVLFVKVSMDGAPYLRKVDLQIYSDYQHLSSALEKMFSCFTIGQCGSHGAPGREVLSESKLRDLLHGSEYVLTYEDKDGDWMLVGDVPWDMFIDSCKRLRIMKGSDAIGLAPRAMEKSRNRK